MGLEYVLSLIHITRGKSDELHYTMYAMLHSRMCAFNVLRKACLNDVSSVVQ